MLARTRLKFASAPYGAAQTISWAPFGGPRALVGRLLVESPHCLVVERSYIPWKIFPSAGPIGGPVSLRDTTLRCELPL